MKRFLGFMAVASALAAAFAVGYVGGDIIKSASAQQPPATTRTAAEALPAPAKPAAIALPAPAKAAEPAPVPTSGIPADLQAAQTAYFADQLALTTANNQLAAAQLAVTAGTSQLAKDKATLDALIAKYFGPPVPEPTPVVPPPAPNINPSGIVATQALIVYEPGTPQPWNAQEVIDAAKAANIQVAAYDATATHAGTSVPAWIAFAKSKGPLPWCGLLPASGSGPCYECKLGDAATIIAALKAFAGKPAAILERKGGHFESRCAGGKCESVWVPDAEATP